MCYHPDNPLEYFAKHHGFFYIKEIFNLPTISIKESFVCPISTDNRFPSFVSLFKQICGLFQEPVNCQAYDTWFSIPPRPRSQKLPLLLSRDEVSRILQATNNLKHHALLAIVYGSGLRVSEAVKLRSEHIDSKKM